MGKKIHGENTDLDSLSSAHEIPKPPETQRHGSELSFSETTTEPSALSSISKLGTNSLHFCQELVDDFFTHEVS